MYQVIVADDEPQFRSWFRSLTGDCQDFRVIGEAGTGKETIKLSKELKPDLVIVDLYMPELDGLEVIRELKQNSSNTKTILISSCGERIYARLAREEGAIAFIPKANLSLHTLRQVLQG